MVTTRRRSQDVTHDFACDPKVEVDPPRKEHAEGDENVLEWVGVSKNEGLPEQTLMVEAVKCSSRCLPFASNRCQVGVSEEHQGAMLNTRS